MKQKRWLCIILCVGLLLTVTGCKRDVSQNHKTLSVVTTIFPPYDFVKHIAGDACSLQMLLPAGGEVHAFEPSVKDIAAIENCDIFVYNGGESDVWVEELLAVCDTKHMVIVRMMDYVELLEEGEEHHHEGHHHEQEEADEHVWTTPENALKIASAITDALIKADEEHQAIYQAGFAGLSAQLTELAQAYSVLENRQERVLIIADRFPFLYMTQRYDLLYTAAFSGCTSNTEASLAQLYTLTSAARRQTAPIILYTEFSDRLLANTVAAAANGEARRLHSCHNVTKDEWQAGTSYVSLMQENLKVLKEALGI